MKVITNNAAFVQKNDVAYLIQSDLEIPASIITKVFGGDTFIIDNHSRYDFTEFDVGRGVAIINDSNRYDFVKFDAPEEIEFFKGIEWIIDYNEVKDLSEDEIIALCQSIAEEKNRIAQKFNSMEIDERKRNVSMAIQCELLDLKMYSLRDFLWFKQGHIKMKLPASIEIENGINKLIKTIFNKKSN